MQICTAPNDLALRICPCGQLYRPTEQEQKHCTVLVLDDHAAETLRSLLECVIANACGGKIHEEILAQLKK